MTIEFDSNADLASRERVRDFRATLDRVGEHLNHRVESVSGWSVAQHLFHVVLATDLGLANVLALVRGKGILIRPEGALAPEAQAVLEAQTVPRGSTQAPRMVVPAGTGMGRAGFDRRRARQRRPQHRRTPRRPRSPPKPAPAGSNTRCSAPARQPLDALLRHARPAPLGDHPGHRRCPALRLSPRSDR
ncbi:MAG: hypothetical protein R3F17_14855 [Planctomycetota bacterium]